MTILVLDIKVPPHMDIYRKITLKDFMQGYSQDIVLYMVVFIALGYLWYIHHDQSHYIQHTDRNHLWISLATLMFIALLPFTSSLVNRFPEDTLAELFLSGNMFIIGVLNYWGWAYAAGKRRLLADTATDRYIAGEKKKLLIFPAVSLLAMCTSFIYPLIAQYMLFLAPVLVFTGKRVRFIRKENPN